MCPPFTFGSNETTEVPLPETSLNSGPISRSPSLFKSLISLILTLLITGLSTIRFAPIVEIVHFSLASNQP